jgi:glycosyltransferase involved in cell wall biosynthesis
MKILYLTPFSPVPPTYGGAIRSYHLLKQLVRRHEVTVVGFGSKSEREAVKNAYPELKNRVYFLDQPFKRFSRKWVMLYSLLSRHSYWYNLSMRNDMQRMLYDVLMSYDFDLVQSEFPILSHYKMPISALKVIDAHNVEYDNFRRMSKGDVGWSHRLLYGMEARKFKHEEIDTIANQDGLFVTSQRDADIFSMDLPDVPKFVIPNGVDLDYFKPWKSVKEPQSLIFVGTMDYAPNIDAMQYFLDRIYPQVKKRVPGLKLYIVGSNPPAEIQQRRSSDVVITDFVPDVRSYMNRSSVFVVPLRMGGGTRLKILEAMAMQIPVVTTSIGCEGLQVTHQETAMIADSARQFTEYVVELLYNRSLRNRLVDQAYQLVTENYSWERVGSLMEGAYRRLRFPESVSLFTNPIKSNGKMEFVCKN